MNNVNHLCWRICVASFAVLPGYFGGTDSHEFVEGPFEAAAFPEFASPWFVPGLESETYPLDSLLIYQPLWMSLYLAKHCIRRLLTALGCL